VPAEVGDFYWPTSYRNKRIKVLAAAPLTPQRWHAKVRHMEQPIVNVQKLLDSHHQKFTKLFRFIDMQTSAEIYHFCNPSEDTVPQTDEALSLIFNLTTCNSVSFISHTICASLHSFNIRRRCIISIKSAVPTDSRRVKDRPASIPFPHHPSPWL
jgi:hypothetical protein